MEVLNYVPGLVAMSDINHGILFMLLDCSESTSEKLWCSYEPRVAVRETNLGEMSVLTQEGIVKD